jgi:hypothetical protein
MNVIRSLVAALALGLLAGPALAQGTFPGYPEATEVGPDYTVPSDTNLDDGTNNITVNIPLSLLTGAWNGGAVSFRNVNTCGTPALNAADGTNATPVVTETYYAEITVHSAGTVTGVATFNGSDATDSIIVALADSTGDWVAWSALAGTQQSGTDAYQLVPFTTPYSIVPGTYYIGYQFDGTTTRYNALTVGHCGASKQTGQTFGTLVDISAPATTFTTAIAPMAGLY